MSKTTSMPSAFRPITAWRYRMTKGIPDPASAEAVQISARSESNGFRDENLRLFVTVAASFYACRHADIERPLDADLFLIQEGELLRQHLLPNSQMFHQTVGSSRYAIITVPLPDGKVHTRIVRSRHGRFGADQNGGIEADNSFPIGFLLLPPPAAKAMLTMGSQVNIGLRNVTALKL